MGYKRRLNSITASVVERRNIGGGTRRTALALELVAEMFTQLGERSIPMDDSRLVYSTEPGWVAKKKRPKSKSGSKNKNRGNQMKDPRDGIVRIRREVKGRKGKQVTTVSGLPMHDDTLKRIATQLKRVCGSGGSIKNGCIMIQGDHRDKVQSELRKEGYSTKIAGG